MKKLASIISLTIIIIIVGSLNISAQTCGNGITYTSNFPWGSVHGTLSTSNGTKHNDTTRLQNLLTQCSGKIIFDESEYYINDSLPVYAYRLLEGSGSGSNTVSNAASYPNNYALLPSSKIIQTVNKPIFIIGTNVYEIAIRDMALIGGISPSSNTNLFGILGQGGTTGNCTPSSDPPDLGNCSSIGAQFSNLSFTNLNKGIYINALNDGEWQFDNIRLDHSRFVGCIIGVHINSHNSGWNISSLDFLIPTGVTQGTDETITGKTYGIYLERSTYTSMDLLIGNGPSSTGPNYATALIYVKSHANLSIQSTVAEGFYEDIVIDGNTRNSPINLMNNSFLNGVRVKDSTLYSSSNMYAVFNNHGTPAIATGASQIYSVGDKFCAEGDTANCDEGRGFDLQDSSRNIFATTQNGNMSEVPFFISKDIYPVSDPIINKFTSAPALSLVSPTTSNGPLLRLGRGLYHYDITRSETSGIGDLEFKSNQDNYGSYTFITQEAHDSYSQIDVKINYDGSVTYGSKTFSTLGTHPNGTMVYCSNCQQTTTCTSGGSGAMAKRIAGNWKCN